MIRCRKLTQAQFEEICQVIPKLNYREVKDLIHYSLYANYEIPQEYYNLFMPYIVLKDHSYVNELKKEHFTNTFTISELLTIGYKINNSSYGSYKSSEIMKAKEILKNDNYKYIDLETE